MEHAAEHSTQLSSYLELCRSLGVVNTRRLPAFERVRDEDVRELERLLITRHDDTDEEPEGDGQSLPLIDLKDTTATMEWVAFDDDKAAARRRGAVDSGTRSFCRRRSRTGGRCLVTGGVVRPELYCCD
uniref:AP180 N-terminal homology (ANTH) domain-containing protein n=1 Tax=Oryza punctata TaxID=4537 RepID=A0A0E0M1W3_ORYPU